MFFTIPNLLTILRLTSAPLLGFILVIFPNPFGAKLALIIFVISALTDFFDGYLARLLQKVSSFGKLLDPIADKALIIISLFSLVFFYKDDFYGVLIIVPSILIIFREIFIMGLREFLAERKISLDVSKMAKIKTFFQMSSILVILFAETNIFLNFSIDYLGYLLLWCSSFLSLYTGIDYFKSSLQYFKD